MKLKIKLLNIGKALILPLAVWVGFSLLSGFRFSTVDSILSVLRTSMLPMLIAMSMAFGMTMGMWNFAAGAIVYTSAIFSAKIAYATGLGIPLLCVLAIVIAVALSALMGGLYKFLRIPCLVLSLGFTMFVEALPGTIIEDGIGKIKLTEAYLASPPWIFLIVFVMFVIFSYILTKTTLGANMSAIGADIRIANSAGINIDKVKFISFIISGVILGVAAIIHMSLNVSVTAVTGFMTASMIFDGIMGVFVALVLTRYVKFHYALIIGVVTIRMLSAGLVACNLSAEIRGIFTGVFLFAVITYSSNVGFIERIKARRQVIKNAKVEIEKAKP